MKIKSFLMVTAVSVMLAGAVYAQDYNSNANGATNAMAASDTKDMSVSGVDGPAVQSTVTDNAVNAGRNINTDMAALDANEDGKVTRREFLTVNRGASDEFKRLDVDEDGVLSQAELDEAQSPAAGSITDNTK